MSAFAPDPRDVEPECEHCGERIRWRKPPLGRAARWEHVRTSWPRCNVEGLAFAAPKTTPTGGVIAERASVGELE